MWNLKTFPNFLFLKSPTRLLGTNNKMCASVKRGVDLRIALSLRRLSNCREIKDLQEMRSLTSLPCKEHI